MKNASIKIQNAFDVIKLVTFNWSVAKVSASFPPNERKDNMFDIQRRCQRTQFRVRLTTNFFGSLWIVNLDDKHKNWGGWGLNQLLNNTDQANDFKT